MHNRFSSPACGGGAEQREAEGGSGANSPLRRARAVRAEEPRTLDLDRFIPYRLSVLTNRVSNAIAREYSSRFGISIPEWRVIAVLGSTAGLSARDVASRTEMDKVQVSRAVASLMRSRRVQRQKDAKDARISRLSLTPRGKSIYDAIAPLALGLESRLLEALSPEDRMQFDRLLALLARQAATLGQTTLEFNQSSDVILAKAGT